MKAVFALTLLLPLVAYAQKPSAPLRPLSPNATVVVFPIQETNAPPAKESEEDSKANVAPVISVTNNLIALPREVLDQANATLTGASFAEMTLKPAPDANSGATSADADSSQLPTTSLVSPKSTPPRDAPSLWRSGDEEISLFELFDNVITGSRPAPASIWTDRGSRFPRPDHLVREPGIRIFTLRF